MSHHIPDKVLNQHIAILGKTGSGKTYTAKGIVEHILRQKQRACIVDPTGVWWGLRSDTTGKKPGFPIVVFGGDHADAPLGQNHGAAIAEIIGTTDTSAVLDTRHMTVGERTRFFADFGEALLRKNRGPLFLILDEAHLFAPQGRVNDPQSGKMLHAANNLVSLGRGVGLRIIMISQRPAKLHKDSLTQAETLIALRLIAPQDRSAVEDWIGEWADPKTGKEVLQSLPSLPTGEGWLWSPESGILERAKFPKITTYDSSRAPDGETSKVVLANIDLPAIQARLETVAADAFDNDPARLKKRIAELERAAKVSPALPAPPPTIIEKLVVTDHQIGQLERAAGTLRADLKDVQELLTAIDEGLKRVQSGQATPLRPTLPPPAPRPTLAPQPRPQPQRATADANGDLSGPEQRIVDAIAWLESIGIEAPEQTAVAFLAGYTTGGGAYNNPRGALRTKGLIEYAAGDRLRLTQTGRSVANYPDQALTNAELQSRVLQRLPGPEQKILSVLLKHYPKPVTNETCAQLSGYSLGGGAYNNPRGRLRTLGLIDYVSGELRARDLLFPEGV